MFKWLGKQGVESDKGFIVQSAGRGRTEYIEQTKKIIISIFDHGKHPNGQWFEIVKTDNFEKWEDGTSISQGKQEEIKRNFIEAMAFQNIDIIFDDKPTPHYTIDDLP